MITFSAQDMLEGLLLKNERDRLGDEDIKAHSFFKSINWYDLSSKRLKPPGKDVLKLGHFGSELTAKAIFNAEYRAEGLPCVSIADDTFNVMN